MLYQDLSDLRTWSEPVTGSFTTPSTTPRDITIAWSADTVGQGWGINPEWGGLRLYETMRRAQPDVFINVGDTIYADGPLLPEVKLDDGSMWKNVVTEAKSKVAESLDDYRGCHRYNLIDEHMRRFIAETSQIVMWDDHEVRDNWYLGAAARRRRPLQGEVGGGARGARRGRRSSNTTRCRSSATISIGSTARSRWDRWSRSSRSTCGPTRGRTPRTGSRRSTPRPRSSAPASCNG